MGRGPIQDAFSGGLHGAISEKASEPALKVKRAGRGQTGRAKAVYSGPMSHWTGWAVVQRVVGDGPWGR